MVRIFPWSIAVALVLLTGVAHAERLIRAEFYSVTGENAKAHDTGVFVTVVSNNGGLRLADVIDADKSSGDQTQYTPQSEHQIDLAVRALGATTKVCNRFKFKVGIRAHGRDTWSVDRAAVILYFDSGATLEEDVGPLEFESRNSRYVESQWLGGN